MNIEKAAVIGAGVMGAAIAAQIANAGVPVYLLDIVAESSENRNAIAEAAIQKLLHAEPAPLMLQKYAKRITPGNTEDHLAWLQDADWVIEAVVEDAYIKRTLYRQLDNVCRPNTLITSNTSTLPLHVLAEGMPEAFRQRFMITHFFNPPRYMRLVELVASSDTRPELIGMLERFADLRLGKDCVRCKDTPGFIANRIGIYWLQCGLLEAMQAGLNIEEADAAISKPFGIPKTGIFGLFDLIGIDLIPHVLDSMQQTLPAGDDFHRIAVLPDLIKNMLADGYTGRKGRGGFYRLHETDGQRIKEAIDLQSGAYRPSIKPQAETNGAELTDDSRAMLSSCGKTALYGWQVMSQTLNYTAGLIPEIADDIAAVDTAIRLGLNWQSGPFELLDKIGVDRYCDKLAAEGREIPPLLQRRQPFYQVAHGRKRHRDLRGHYRLVPRPEGLIQLADIKLQQPAVLENPSASLWDIADGVACLEFHSKMNTLDMDSIALIERGIDKVRSEFAALVIYNDADNFSAGANLNLLTTAINKKDWAGVGDLIRRGQQAFKALKYAPFPIVGAPSGLALGGGCEILLHCDARQAHAELYIGLVETGVGLIPAWGGCKEYLGRCLMQPKRFGGPVPPLVKAFETIGKARVSKSAFEAKQLLFLSEIDGITMNRQRLLTDAKAMALSLYPQYRTPQAFEYRLPGKAGKILLSMTVKGLLAIRKIGAYDAVVADHLAEVLSGGGCNFADTLDEDAISALELDTFIQLCQQAGTLARLEHLLETGKPLRN
ncbi:MAG: 3-hydroxyacyl-CoA dehydrogenase NAD-binding domain-containing protein [Gammaproteobacteria bacterium]